MLAACSSRDLSPEEQEIHSQMKKELEQVRAKYGQRLDSLKAQGRRTAIERDTPYVVTHTYHTDTTDTTVKRVEDGRHLYELDSLVEDKRGNVIHRTHYKWTHEDERFAQRR
jgi:hypothetical protein